MTNKLCSILDCIQSQQEEGVILPLCSALVRPHLEYYVHVWSPQYRRYMDPLEHVHRKATKMIQEMEQLSMRTG